MAASISLLTAYLPVVQRQSQISACSSAPLPCWNVGDGAWRRTGAQLDVRVFLIHRVGAGEALSPPGCVCEELPPAAM